MNGDRNKMAERVIHLTLEILFRLTGEDYTVVKKTSRGRCQAPVSEGLARTPSSITLPPSHPLKQEDINDQKILELANKITELLAGEVSIRCQDVAVYFSKEEWEYLEGHKDLYKNTMMEVPQPLTEPGDIVSCPPKKVISKDFTAEDCGITQNTKQQHVNIPSIPSAPHGICKLFYPVKLVFVPDSVQTVKKINNERNNAEEQRIQKGETSYSFSQNITHVPQTSHVAKKKVKYPRKQTYSCPECGKCFKQNGDLANHYRIHTGEKPFSCSVCGKSFNQKTHLNRHKIIHTGVKPYVCSKCGSRFFQKVDLEKHERKHTGAKPFSCSECGKCFSVKISLTRHLTMHTRK